ncbi:hypothetical protein BH10BAC5_BH10BAC5_27290 [soil metagenome]
MITLWRWKNNAFVKPNDLTLKKVETHTCVSENQSSKDAKSCDSENQLGKNPMLTTKEVETHICVSENLSSKDAKSCVSENQGSKYTYLHLWKHSTQITLTRVVF